jgi:hypothetical protein
MDIIRSVSHDSKYNMGMVWLEIIIKNDYNGF